MSTLHSYSTSIHLVVLGKHASICKFGVLRGTVSTSITMKTIPIPVLCGFRPPQSTAVSRAARQRVLIKVIRRSKLDVCTDGYNSPPKLYVLNAAAITKPHDIEHLDAEFWGYKIDVAIVSETHLKRKHSDHHFVVNFFSLFAA